jgi:signal transduction histidine kinase
VVAAGAERPTPHDEIAAYALGTDVTDRRALERRAAEAEALAHMGTLAAGLAHEVRNPLNAALLQLHLLGRGIAKVVTEERDPLLARARIVEGELKRLERLLSDFLELARPRPMAREPIDLAALLDEVTSFQEPAAAAAGVTLVRRISEARAVGDRERLKQVFHNLLVNALEATPLGGMVTVSCHRNADEPDASVTIADTGRGIPGGTMDKVFEPFFTTKEAGTGLGLSIVRQIVERHGGAVDLESAEGKGTRVTLNLPATGKAY